MSEADPQQQPPAASTPPPPQQQAASPQASPPLVAAVAAAETPSPAPAAATPPAASPAEPAAAAAAAPAAEAAPAQGDQPDQVMSRLRTLRTLHEAGLIGDQEFEVRRTQLVNQLTGTTGPSNPGAGVNRRRRQQSLEANLPPIVAKPPPEDFEDAKTERATLHSFDPRSNRWSTVPVTVRMEESPFARGALRLCYYCTVQLQESEEKGGRPVPQAPTTGGAGGSSFVAGSSQTRRDPLSGQTGAGGVPGGSPPNMRLASPSGADPAATTGQPAAKPTIYVAKLSIDPKEDRQTYFIDVQIQMYARMFAERFNAYNPPKKVDFLKAWILELVERPQAPLCGLERYIDGPYRKHNNNFGYVSDLERSTPQAFSHFTYEASGHVLLVCDIQGVDDVYTDPQVHTVEDSPVTEQLLGKGNMGPLGFQQFLSGHKCNAICQYLRLPPVNAKSDLEDMGTMPAQRYMPQNKVNVVEVGARPEKSTSPVPSPSSRLLPDTKKKEESSACCCVL